MELPQTGRPLVSRRAVVPWLVLLATLPLGLWSYYQNDQIGLFTWQPGERMGLNYRTFQYAAERARDGAEFYDVAPPGTRDWAIYLYPPGTVPSFYPFTLVEWTTGYAILTGLSVLAAAGATWAVVQYVESLGPDLGWVDIALIFTIFLLSKHAYGTIYFGNINIILAFAVAVGLWALQRDRQPLSGASFALAALYKLFPALIGLWLLRRRQWRAVGAALTTGLGGLLLGVVLYGTDTTWYYFTEVVSQRAETDLFVGGYPVDGTFYVTIQQPVSHLVAAVWPGAPYSAILGVSAVIYGGTLAYFYWNLNTELDRQMALFATFVVIVSFTPSLQWYLVLLYPSLIAVLYLWTEGLARIPFVLGGILMSVTADTETAVDYLDSLPDPLYDPGYFFLGHGVIPLYGLLLMLAACAWHKRRRESTGWAGSRLDCRGR